MLNPTIPFRVLIKGTKRRLTLGTPDSIIIKPLVSSTSYYQYAKVEYFDSPNLSILLDSTPDIILN